MFNKVTNWLKGRTTTFLCGFFVAGHVLQALHKLDATYIAYMTAFMGFVLGHSVKEGIEAKNGGSQ